MSEEIKKFSISLERFLTLSFTDQEFIYKFSTIDYPADYYHEIVYETNDENFYKYYMYTNKLHKTRRNFYLKKQLQGSIWFNKVTKKIITKNFRQIQQRFLRKFFKHTSLVNVFIEDIKVSNTLIKNIILGKINTLEDIINYKKSYVLKDKTASSKGIFNVTVFAGQHIANIRNFEIFESIENCEKLTTFDFTTTLIPSITFEDDLNTDKYLIMNSIYDNKRKEKIAKIMQKYECGK
jgi:hypothetical protein